MQEGTEFWRLKTVVARTGRSKSDIYRMEAAGKFPKRRKYPDGHGSFWLSCDVIAWQQSVLDDFDALLA